jgi:hypothetical protein
MKQQTIFLWTGGAPESARGCEGMADHLRFLPAPARLRRAAHIAFRWGESTFELLAGACSVRITSWGDRQMTWLHCKAIPIGEVRFGAVNAMQAILFPAHYVTAIVPGPPCHTTASQLSGDLGVFPPTQPPPDNALALREIERLLVELMDPADDSFRWA